MTLCLLLAIQTLFGQTKFSEQQLRDDLLFYKLNLERYHPNLYLYNSKDNFNHFFDSLIYSINQSMIEADFYRIITLTSGLIKDGHTLILPSNAFIEHHNSHSRFLPLQIGIYKEQLYVKMNCTSSILVEDGTIIDSINGVSSNEIIKVLIARQVRDGNNISYSNWILDTYFREYYSYTFGHPEVYEISYKKDDGAYRIEIPALFKDSIYQYRTINYPKIYSKNAQSKGVYLEYDSSQNVAILTINDFHSEVLKSEFNQNFSKETKSIFENIFLVNPKNLVIDIRNNQGGDVENGVNLLRYLINQPFRITEEYNRIKNGKTIRCKGPSQGIHKPYGKRFTGQVYVLLNGGSFSNSVIFSSCLKEHTNTIFVGMESGGNPNVLAGYTKDLELPNTKIRVEIPTKQFIMTNLKRNDGNGLIPNYEIDNSIQDNIQQNDKQLDFVMKLIKENNK
jgi:hypothetical protein